VHWFADVVVHPGLEAAHAVARHGVRGHRDDWRVAATSFAPPNLRGRLVAVHPWHLAIHQDRVKALALERRQGLMAVVSDLDSAAAALEHSRRDDPVDRAVLGD